jgi:hypothetical protein
MEQISDFTATLSTNIHERKGMEDLTPFVALVLARMTGAINVQKP